MPCCLLVVLFSKYASLHSPQAGSTGCGTAITTLVWPCAAAVWACRMRYVECAYTRSKCCAQSRRSSSWKPSFHPRRCALAPGLQLGPGARPAPSCQKCLCCQLLLGTAPFTPNYCMLAHACLPLCCSSASPPAQRALQRSTQCPAPAKPTAMLGPPNEMGFRKKLFKGTSPRPARVSAWAQHR